MRHAFARRWEAHGLAMRALYWRGLAVAGLFTFLPGRVFNRMFFPEMPELGYGVIALHLNLLYVVWIIKLHLRTIRMMPMLNLINYQVMRFNSVHENIATIKN